VRRQDQNCGPNSGPTRHRRPTQYSGPTRHRRPTRRAPSRRAPTGDR
jgi:hypothetical protein